MATMPAQTVTYSTEISPQMNPNHPYILRRDRSSAEGKFGWATFGEKAIPYIFRCEEKFVSVEMTICQVLDVYVKFFSEEVYSCCKIPQLNMTSFEAALLNEINVNHSNSLFGHIKFTDKNKLMSLRDAVDFTTYLHFCYETLINNGITPGKACGFIRINGENCMPYVWYNSRQYVPLFYIDGECKYLEDRSIVLNGWPLTYLKVCCKIHGIRKSLFDGTSITVVDLELVKTFFPPGTPFEDSWPLDDKTETLLEKNIVDAIRPAYKRSVDDVQRVQEKTMKHNRKRPKNKFVQENAPHTSITERNLHSIENNPKLDIGRNAVPSSNNTTNQVKQNTNTTSGYRVLIPDFPILKEGCPYFQLRTVFAGRYLYWSVNAMPFDPSIILVTIEEVASVTQIPLHLFMHVITRLKFTIYIPNAHQKKVLAAGRLDQTIGLIEMNDLISSISDIKNVCYKSSLKR